MNEEVSFLRCSCMLSTVQRLQREYPRFGFYLSVQDFWNWSILKLYFSTRQVSLFLFYIVQFKQ